MVHWPRLLRNPSPKKSEQCPAQKGNGRSGEETLDSCEGNSYDNKGKCA